MKFKARAYRHRHKPGEQNSTERAYVLHLEALKKSGEILEYSFECETLKLGQDCRYTPDFRVIKYYLAGTDNDLPIIEFHEVKGTRKKKGAASKPFIEDDALVKIKAAAQLHPYKFIIVWRDGDAWQTREIN